MKKGVYASPAYARSMNSGLETKGAIPTELAKSQKIKRGQTVRALSLQLRKRNRK